jgi:hypothetical protein
LRIIPAIPVADIGRHADAGEAADDVSAGPDVARELLVRAGWL